MKKNYKSILFTGMALAGISAGIFVMNFQKTPPPEAVAHVAKADRLPAEMSEATLADIRGMLEKQEYHISYDPDAKSLQSPNRAQNLRAYYRPGKLTVQTRIDTTGEGFKLELINEGIYADGKPLYAPQPNAKTDHQDNQVEIVHDAFTEEFVNNENGVRQNFIVDHAPAGTRELQVRMSARGLDVQQGNGNELRFLTRTANGETRNALTYSDLKCWDANKQPLSANLAYADGQIRISVDVANAAYPVTIDPIIVNGTPQNSNKVIEVNQSNMWLGYSVSSAGDVNGDGYSDIVVGAPKYDKTKTNEGVAIVFKGTANGLSLAGEFLVSGQEGAQMGYSVATAGDFNGDGFSDVLVGVPFYSVSPTDSVGQARLYFGSAGGITPQSTFVTYSSANPDANTGVCVATAGDVNGDGYSDVLIGAHQDTDGESKEGLVRVSYGGSGNNLNTNFATLQCNQANAMFGFSAASAGDVDGDGFSDVAVGARFYDHLHINGGAVFVYRGSASGLIINNADDAMLTSGSEEDSRMGHKVSSAGDVNGDGFSDLLVSEYMDDGEDYLNRGRVILFLGSSTGVHSYSSKKFDGTQNDERLGTSVACAGDVNGDGYADILLGAQYYDNGQTNEGAVFVHHGGPNGVSDTPAAILESNQNEGWFGTAAASAGDVNGDGYSDILVGCYTFDNGQNDEGHAFIYQGGPEGIGTNGAVTLTGSDGGSLMGYSVAIAGDVNGDGFDEVIVGAPEYDYNGTFGGIAILYYGSINGIDPGNKLVLSKNKTSGYFGGSVAAAGDVDGNGYGDIIIGAQGYTNGENGEGVAFLYYGSSTGINAGAGLLIEKNSAMARFGASVAGAGDVNRDGYADIIIGSPHMVSGQEAIHVYYGSANGPVNPVTIPVAKGGFGFSVSTAGDINGDGYSDILAGAFAANLGEAEEGAVYIYYGSLGGINTTGKVLQSNQASAYLGASVSAAGDVNGDGFGDIIAGASRYNSEGTAIVYYGAAAGINELNPTSTYLYGDAPYAYFGSSVRGAGDVNGDGYADVIVGAYHHENGQVHEGKAYVYHGSPSGIKPAAAFSIEGDKVDGELGTSVSGAGDVNGDGYSDIIVGTPHANSPLVVNTGNAKVFYGNNSKGLRNSVRLFNSDLVTPISYSQFILANFVGGMYAKSFIGRNKGKFVWETKGPGVPFSKVGIYPITTSNQFTDATTFSNLTGTTFISSAINKTGIATKVRVRVRYSPVLAITGQVYGPWRYVQAQLAGYNNAPVPEEAMAETIKRHAEPAIEKDEHAVTLFPNPVTDRLSIQAAHPGDIRSVRLFDNGGKLVYQSSRYEKNIDVSKLPEGMHILVVDQHNGKSTSHKILIRR
ncbi:hypothetical protein GCM10010967_34960 [Dyadobacter beijingensis]|uniref:Secretion system C-terminal sorting domain-containing protein n=1 Tax=Dyadobacter beijingensis TaxID=365489 RepID=A0ABQ2I458_9BACT|nr:FG-GAP-like repeat-containing protein [Dyadobacter beijingensis]GGM98155.1 hypothetical protein GCM10010967_34960 [Dyadobacter beijingensis]